MNQETMQATLICAACGYQWDQECRVVLGLTGPGGEHIRLPSTFEENCPVCNANMVHQYAPAKEKSMGEDYDGRPWY